MFSDGSLNNEPADASDPPEPDAMGGERISAYSMFVREGHFWMTFEDPDEIIYRFRPLRTVDDFKNVLDVFLQCSKETELIGFCEGVKRELEMSKEQIAILKHHDVSEDCTPYVFVLKYVRNLEAYPLDELKEFTKLQEKCGITVIEALCILLYSHEIQSNTQLYSIINGALACHDRDKIGDFTRFIGTMVLGLRKLKYVRDDEDCRGGPCHHYRRIGVEPFTGDELVVPNFYSTTQSFEFLKSLGNKCEEKDPDIIVACSDMAAVVPACLLSRRDEQEVLYEPGTRFRNFGLPHDRGCRVFEELPIDEQISLFLPFHINYYSEREDISNKEKEIACLHFLHAQSWKIVREMAEELANPEWHLMKKTAEETNGKSNLDTTKWEIAFGGLSDAKKKDNIVFRVLSFLEEDFQNPGRQSFFLAALYSWIKHFERVCDKYSDIIPVSEDPEFLKEKRKQIYPK